MKARGWGCGLLLLFTGAPAQDSSLAGPHPGLAWWSRPPLEKVRPMDPPRRPPPYVETAAARNEFEPLQLVLRSSGSATRAIDVEVSDFVPENGSRRLPSSSITVYFLRFLNLPAPSSAGGGTGEWPDALIPRLDTYAGERRSAFPFDLPADRSQPLWLEVYVPRDAPPGNYRAEILITVSGVAAARVPWILRVRDFELPSTSTFPTTFGFSGVSASRGHHGRYTDDEDLLELTHVYAKAALRHRISLHGGSQIPPQAVFDESAANIDWQAYDREVGPFLDGGIFGESDPLPGARATSIDVRTPSELDDARTVLYWRAWAEHFRSRGWLDRLFLYLWDEPEDSDYPRVHHRGQLARRADSALPILLTEPWTPRLAGVVDLWVPLINCLERRRGVDNPCGSRVAPERYAQSRRSGGELWWYQSCASHGCNVVGGRELAGWPSYVIDAPAVAARVMPWIAWMDGVEGELYFNTVEAYGAGPNPWDDIRRHGGNGDGTLFYPGAPDRIGGETHIPIESLRLKLIRDGLEDYEYLRLLESATSKAEVRKLAGAIASPRRRWDPEPGALAKAREAIATRLEARALRADEP